MVSGLEDEKWMLHAIKCAEQAQAAGEVPVGAVIVANGQFIAEGYNQTIMDNDCTAHAEIVALRAAGQRLQNYRLVDCTLYCTLEPCCMCVGAIIHARLKRVVYGTYDPKTGAVKSQFQLLTSALHNQVPEVSSGVCQQQCADQLRHFFKQRRFEQKTRKNL
ncbi:MAG: tRNA adenosine(34) deaminase TadA [bacterium]